MSSTTVIGRIGRHKSRPDRLALILPSGKPGWWFAPGATLAEVAAVLAASGYVVGDDGNVLGRV